MTQQLHQKPRSIVSLSDEWETPRELYDELCNRYKINPAFDVAATSQNTLCVNYKTKEDEIDGLQCNWIQDTWVNPPHSLNEEFVRKAYEQNQKNNTNVIMILPCNAMSAEYWHDCIEKKAEYHPIKGRIRFLIDGKLSKFASRNAYVAVIWRKK